MANFIETSAYVPTQEATAVSHQAGPTAEWKSQRYESGVDASGQVFVKGINKVDWSPSQEAPAFDGIIGTGQNTGGLRISSADQIKPTTLFTVDGMQLTADNLVHLGLLAKEGGRYFIPRGTEAEPKQGQKAPAQATPKAEAQEVNAYSYLDRQTASGIEALETLAGPQSDAVITRGIAAVITGEPVASDLASALGAEHGDVDGAFKEVFAGMEKATAKHLTKAFGVKGQDVLDYLADHLSESKRASLASRVYYGDSTVYQEMVTLYRRKTA